MAEFVHLHTHSHYSLLDGLGKIEHLITRAKKLEMSALALTDHGAMYGIIEFYQKAKAEDIKPILGVETYLAPRKLTDKTAKLDTYPSHLVLLAKDNQGYQNLIQLVTIAHLQGYYYKPRIDKETLKKYSHGLIGLSACLQGEVTRLAAAGNLEKTKKVIKEYQEIFGPENFYLELQKHKEFAQQEKANQNLIKIAQEIGAPLVATNDIHYVDESDKEVHEVLLAVQTGKNIDDEQRLTLKQFNLSMLSEEQMRQNFKDVPEALENTAKIAERCNVELELGKVIMPTFELPKGENPKSYLEKKVYVESEKIYGKEDEQTKQEAKNRLQYELEVIEKTGFADYFLIVADFVNFAKEHGIGVGPGRGSAAGSIVSYCLNITDVDPLKYGLLFERFLNPDRIAPPDIDMDFADDRRGEVIDYISKKYGQDHIAQIITFGTMASRGSVRDAGRALGMSYGDVDKIAKLIPFGMTLEQSLESVNELFDIYSNDARVKKLINIAQKLEGVVHHASTHAAGIVLSKEPLIKYTPLQYGVRGENEIITQYSMYDIEAVGLVKMDLLGLANLTIIKHALDSIAKNKKINIALKNLPFDDEKTYQLLSAGETTGVFQLESDGMKRYLKQLKPNKFSDIVAMTALYRPGPIQFIPDFIAGHQGKKIPTYIHPKLEPILKETYGIVVYQEQILQIARDIAGFSLGEADILRKAIGKKQKKLLMKMEKKFIDGAIANNVVKKIAEKIFQFIEPFASYGFNKSHAVCYAFIAYQTAYLKAHFPSEFMAALLVNEQNDLEKLAIAIAECEAVGIKVLPPDINHSFANFDIVKGGKDIRFGLAAIKNVGRPVAEAIAAEREKNGLYKSLEEFVLRATKTVINKKSLESLAKAGALDNFAERNLILANVEAILKIAGGQGDAESQLGLFEKKAVGAKKLELTPVEPALKKQRLAWERAFLGVYLSEHPLKDFKEIIAQKATQISHLFSHMSGQKITVGGVVVEVMKIATKSGEPMAFAQIEDESGKIEAIVFPKVLQQNESLWRVDKIVLVEGEMQSKEGKLKILVRKAIDLEDLNGENYSPSSPKKKILQINLPSHADKKLMLKIKEVLNLYPGETPVFLYIYKNGDKLIATKTKVEPSSDIIASLEEVLGENCAKIKEVV